MECDQYTGFWVMLGEITKCNVIQGGSENITHPYLLKLLQVAEMLLIILFQNEKVP